MPKDGCRTRLISPAGPVNDEQAFAEGLRILEHAGITSVPGPIRRKGWLAGSDRERLDELMDAATDADADVILAVRGGGGCQRLLPLLDVSTLAESPKPLCGSSDVSVLLNRVAAASGMITFHTPMLTTLARVDAESRDATIALFKGRPPASPPPLTPFRRPGRPVRGRLFGGNMAVLASLAGTPFAAPFAGAVVFLEDTGEPPYRIDRMFQQLRQAGLLKEAAAILLGDFTVNGETVDPRLVAELAAEAAGEDCPVFTGLACGHGERNLPLPVGCECVISEEGMVGFIYP